MDHNLPIIAKKFWNIVRVAFFMLKKGISKRKFMLDFNLFMKRGKIASKAAIHAPATTDDDVFVMNAAVVKALEMLQSANASPANDLPGFGRTPTVRQLRVTDSPFPLRDVEDDSHVDEAAENFISKFYRDLRRQASPTPN
ncbi:PREDICTED: uncharacterized protein LOC109210651 [Nicotiana attenuata]|uniref:Avr9/Cf-9 rapidly elicited protein 146 n=1 Tax=Nicotiana attenuata TaxID=49451 RepID=A0A314KL29_NICAT|nr:PREDICTED: uncharacterized protein LOC109210651 [Nicotiana attenuata]OIT29958.1 hypothetical protein A4A49_38373 [Nicotiana attenuata]